MFIVFAEKQESKRRTSDMKITGALFLAIALGGPAFAQSKPVSMFGFTLGEPMPETKQADGLPDCHLDQETGIATCASQDYRNSYRDGKLVQLNRAGNFTMADAIKKFGQPTSLKVESKQNTFGARWNDRIAEWVLPNIHVRFEEGHDPSDTHNWILLETRAEYNRTTLADRKKEARTNPLD